MKKLVFALTLLLSNFSYSAFNTGNEILALCEAQEGEEFYFQKIAECRGYVAGVYDHFTGTVKDGVLCLNGKITIGQIRKVFIAYANKNPAVLNEPADIVVENSIYNAFKCSKN